MKQSYRITALVCVIVVFAAVLPALMPKYMSVGAVGIDTEQHSNYINGAADGYFYPNNPLTRAEIAQMLYNIVGKSSKNSAVPSFSDVDGDSWYYEAVSALSSAGIVKGYADGTFRPAKVLTRAELVNILVIMSGKSTAGAKASFTDVQITHWAYRAIGVAEANGWIKGADGKFKPNDKVTRAEAVSIINRYLGRQADKAAIDIDPLMRYFPDVNPSDWFYYDVMEASVSHNVCGEGETWCDIKHYPVTVPDGFYMVSGKLRLVRDREFVLSAEEGVLGGVSYTADENGVVTLLDGGLILNDGTSMLAVNGEQVTADGLYDTKNGLFCLSGGKIRTDCYYNSLYFGSDGRYTSGNAEIDEYVDGIVASETNPSMTQTEKLRALYDYIYRTASYRANNNHVPRGADASEWTEEHMLRLMNTGKGNCYCYAAEMYYFARRIGYDTASAVSGGVTSDNLDHGWVTVTIDDEILLLDPELDVSSGPYAGSCFLVTYKNAPFRYLPSSK